MPACCWQAFLMAERTCFDCCIDGSSSWATRPAGPAGQAAASANIFLSAILFCRINLQALHQTCWGIWIVSLKDWELPLTT